VLVETDEQWRRWLEQHHASEREVWLVTFKKGSGKRSLGYEEALDEATCFGWVDGLVRGGDSEYFLLRWTPRRPKSNWSAGNRERATRLAMAGRMAPAGIAALPSDLREQLRST
jgi:uncharacterized protein YdeI (YjbR/CyaY-like superfamily)